MKDDVSAVEILHVKMLIDCSLIELLLNILFPLHYCIAPFSLFLFRIRIIGCMFKSGASATSF